MIADLKQIYYWNFKIRKKILKNKTDRQFFSPTPKQKSLLRFHEPALPHTERAATGSRRF
jgi:hypothetical protein